ncbi:MAG: hypothetical protein ACXW2V_02200 [Candidatus Aminicenantales bacterium]
MTLILAAVFLSIIPTVYFLRLMSDARKLEKRVLVRQADCGEDALADDELLIEPDYPLWMEVSRRPAIRDLDRLPTGRN